MGNWIVSFFKTAHAPSRQLICLLGALTAFAAVNARANIKNPTAPKPRLGSGSIDGLLGQPEPQHTLGVILLGLWTDLPRYADSELVLPIG